MSTKPKAGRGKSTQEYSAPALDKGLDILEHLAACNAALLPAQIARDLNRGQSELFRMLLALERRGYITRQAESGGYVLTLRLWEMAHAHSPFQAFLRAAQKPMRELAETTGESCHLSTLHRGRLLNLAQEESAATVRLSVEVGSTSTLAGTVSGRVLLAFLPREECEAILLAEKISRAKRLALNKKLEEIAACGYDEGQSESIEGVWDVAAPLGAFAAGLPVALAIAAPTRLNRKLSTPTLRAALLETCRAINDAAGLKEKIGKGTP